MEGLNDHQLEIIFWNAHSMKNKLLEMKRYIYTQKPHVVCIQETWVKDDKMIMSLVLLITKVILRIEWEGKEGEFACWCGMMSQMIYIS